MEEGYEPLQVEVELEEGYCDVVLSHLFLQKNQRQRNMHEAAIILDCYLQTQIIVVNPCVQRI